MTEETKVKKGEKWRRLRTARRVSQGLFLLAFLWLIGETVAITGAKAALGSAERLPYPVELFLDIDPFAGAMVLLTTGTIPGAMILGLIVLASGFAFGRGFCGWVCPMGTLNHMLGAIGSRLKGKKRLRANETRPYQRIKYLVLIGALGAALFGSAIGGLMDPISLATRGIALTVVPILEWLFSGTLGLAWRSDVTLVQNAADGLHDALGQALLRSDGTMVSGGVILSLVFVAVLIANRFIPRFWCRGLCPLGALLGLAGRFGILTLKKNEAACTACNKCQLSCQGAASPKPGDRWRRAECDLCLNCVAGCPESEVLTFGLSGYETDEAAAPDLKRRQVIAGAASGAALVPVLRTGALGSPEGRPDPSCIRPPGAVDEAPFLSRCIRCGQCMKVCPNNALHPALGEAGVEGLWTPVLVPRIGYCEPTCTLCTEVCPTAAIRRVTQKQKTARGPEMVRIGTAFIDRGRCLPWAMETPCIVCEEFCPVSPKAIVVAEETVAVDGEERKLLKPSVRPDRCNGCGACEFICPVNDRAAIRVSSVGESRSQNNTLLQSRGSAKKAKSKS
jgi:polyferredoxin